MRIDDKTLDAIVHDGLDTWSASELSGDPDLWPTVLDRLQARKRDVEHGRRPRSRRRLQRTIAVPLVSVLLAICGVTVAAAASPSVRTTLQHLWPFDSGPTSQGYSPTGAPLYMSPLPQFHVFYPAHIPSELTVHGVGHVLTGGLANQSPSPFGLTYNCGGTACGNGNATLQQLFPPDPSGAPYFPSAVSPAVKASVEAVWFGFHAPLPGQDYISIAEWNAGALPTPSTGETLTINGVDAHVQRAGKELTIRLQMDGTAITVETDLTQASATTVLESLQLKQLRPNR